MNECNDGPFVSFQPYSPFTLQGWILETLVVTWYFLLAGVWYTFKMVLYVKKWSSDHALEAV